MDINLQILRQAPDRKPHPQRFSLKIDPKATVLDCLIQIKGQQDGSVAFRSNCRNTICGSCGMQINGIPGLACQKTVAEALAFPPEPNTITVAPLGNLPVIKDLVVDMQPFWQGLAAIQPQLTPFPRPLGTRESLQLPEDREKLQQVSNCILCGACYSNCDGKKANPEFFGPHALAKAYRVLADSRNQNEHARLAQVSELAGVWGCSQCKNCNMFCPMGVEPMNQINQIKTRLYNHPEIPKPELPENTAAASSWDLEGW